MSLLVIDIGNTNSVIGLFDGKHLKKSWRIESSRPAFLRWARRAPKVLDHVIVSSVVPPLNKTIRTIWLKSSFVGPNMKMPIRIRVKNPTEVGPDRIVNAVGVYCKWNVGARRAVPLLVIDFGTATTFDVVTAIGDFIGGAITPGIGIANEALAERCAKLPRVPLGRPQRTVGQSTAEAIQSGVFFGYASLVEGMIQRFKKECGSNLKVIATGGLARLVSHETKGIEHVDPLLTLRGLNLLYEMNA